MSWLNNLLAGFAGLVFALGLGLSGMTNPQKVLGFLRITGDWDPSLAFVMMGALAVHSIFVRIAQRRERPLLTLRFAWPTAQGVDARLVVGAALFGIGWGLSGYCPGPAIVALATLSPSVLVFCVAMISTLAATHVLLASAERPLPEE